MEKSKIIVWAIWIFLVLSMLIYIIYLIRDCIKNKEKIEKDGNNIIIIITAFFTQFFDTLGIGSFAIMTSVFRGFKLIKDKILPGTLNTAATTSVMLQALIFIKTVEVDTKTLVLMTISALTGALLMSGVVSKLSEKTIQIIMSITLFILALIIISAQLKLTPLGGDATGLYGVKLIIGVIGNFIFGILMTVGIGLYAPCLALVYFLGMNPAVAFPIMMCSCAVLMPFASMSFIKNNAYNRKISILFLFLGAIGVFIAAFIVKSMNIYWITWLVVVVLIYTSFNLLMTYLRKKINIYYIV